MFNLWAAKAQWPNYLDCSGIYERSRKNIT